MGKLRDQMLMDMELRNFSPKTIEAYLGHMVSFTRLFGRSPAEMGEPEIRRYLHYLLREKQVSWSNINVGYCALKFFYTKTLHRSWNVEHIPRPKTPRTLPEVLSRDEVQRIFEVTPNLKHRTILMTTYSGGLRVSEVAHLKIGDIDSGRMTIRVNQGKGRKDRYTILSEVCLRELRRYYLEYRPRIWLFPGKDQAKPIDVGTIQRVFKDAKHKAGIRKQATPHTLRHSFATHFLEDGGNVFRLKELLGHRFLQTTLIYVHIQNEHLTEAISPLDRMGG
ncbi:MAG: tyrosine-type recombinase/integrase [Candidatus Zixiibacteriota bacterium]